MLTTGELAILKEKITGGIMVLERLEEALEAQLEYRDEKTGLYFVEGELQDKNWTGGLGPIFECQSAFREGSRCFYCDCNATMWGTLLVMAEIEDLAHHNDRSQTYWRNGE